ncbi:hypothetical protein PGT21_020899 [Puccinia graminis f. sp. tritici]|uniref:Uncharacterized protein n=1 Tax=Puccinia graminis f. sp. tritici TaxID=56615 RepID=A0A5B0QFX1_PUCGR|nr:hypothetical protein PGT21_020899 [Puccinia graminis f. sp. tritici]
MEECLRTEAAQTVALPAVSKAKKRKARYVNTEAKRSRIYTAVAGRWQIAANLAVNLTDPAQPALTGKKRASASLPTPHQAIHWRKIGPTAHVAILPFKHEPAIESGQVHLTAFCQSIRHLL